MRTIKFTSLHGVSLTGKVSQEIKLKRCNVAIVYALNKIYAITDGYSLVECPDNTNMDQVNKLILDAL